MAYRGMKEAVLLHRPLDGLEDSDDVSVSKGRNA